MSLKILISFAVVILASGCMTEQPSRKFNHPPPGASDGQFTTSHEATAQKEKPTEVSEELKEQRKEQSREVHAVLENIRKEAREEYAATRPEHIKGAILKEELCLGMDEKDVLVCLGQPERKTRTVTRRGVRETWGYSKVSVWLEEGRVTGWREGQ